MDQSRDDKRSVMGGKKAAGSERETAGGPVGDLCRPETEWSLLLACGLPSPSFELNSEEAEPRGTRVPRGSFCSTPDWILLSRPRKSVNANKNGMFSENHTV